MDMYTYIHICKYTHIFIYSHIYTHTHTQNIKLSTSNEVLGGDSR